MFRRRTPTRLGVFRKADLQLRNRPPLVAGMIVSTLTIFLGFTIAIAARTSVPEVTRAPGEIAPTDDFRQIEAPELSTVVSVDVREGDLVREGEVLATLTSSELSREMSSIEAELETLRGQRRNHAFILEKLEGETFLPLPTISETAILAYGASTLRAFQAQRIGDLETIERLSTEAKRHVTALKRLRIRAVEKGKQVKNAASLFEKGLSTQAQLTATKDALADIEDQIHRLELGLSATERELASMRAKLIGDRLALREKHVEQKYEVEQQLSLKEVERQTLQNRMKALEVIAPTDGLIHSVGFPNRGEIIERGETLFELLPTGDALVAVLRLPTRDIGHISPGMTVRMSLETFDARSTQPLVGQIRSISPNRIFDRDLAESYFRATVEIDENAASFTALQDRLTAGMALTAEVVTRERSMLVYILKPIENSVSSAFGER
ncbi:MAG: HlyD family efflux transporter periplasmic adaptor subunit [Pseudomonadota bacterium]